MNNNIIKIVLRFVAYLALQILFFRNASFFGSALAFPYVGFILLLPLAVTNVTSLFVAFFTGLVIDVFYDTLGMHAAACTFMAFIRINLYNWIPQLNSLEPDAVPSVYNLGTQWYSYFSLILIFCHHIVLFAIEGGIKENFASAFGWALTSTLFTYAILISIQYIFITPSRRR